MKKRLCMLMNCVVGFPVLAAGIFLAGCAGASASPARPARLKTEYLFRDEPMKSSQTVSDYDALVFKSGDSEIYGQILKPQGMPDGRRPCVLMFHGFAGFGRFDDIGQALCRAGCVVVIPHHRGAWGSQGKYSISNCVQDAVGLVKYAKSPEFQKKYGIDPDAVFLIGHSMGGNTVLNAAAEVPGVRGIVLLAPCDIGTMYRQTPKDKMKTFLVENGLEVLRTDGFEAVYADLGRHAEQYAFPNAAKKLKNVRLFLVTGDWDNCISNDLLKGFYETARHNKMLPGCSFKCYPARHGLMGVRTQLSCDIANFIVRSLEDRFLRKEPAANGSRTGKGTAMKKKDMAQKPENNRKQNTGGKKMAGFYDYSLTARTGETVKMESFRGKVVLVVNTATGCGFTPQYAPIEQLYKDYHDKGLEILDIPCNQFGGQAPGSDDEIHEFCTVHFNTTFPQMKKSDVNGPNELPLYTFLKSQKGFQGFEEHKFKALLEEMFAKADPDWAKKPDIKWNFTKFVIDRSGKVVARFEPTADMAKVEECIKSLL